MKAESVDATILQQPFDRGVRLVALSLIDDAKSAAQKLRGLSEELRRGAEDADEALHDFRVAVRRVRSWLGAFKPWLKGDISRKRRRSLSKIADATRQTRDASEHLRWLRGERTALSARQRIGENWLKELLEEDRKDGCDAALSAAADFVDIEPALVRKIEFYHASVREPDAGERFGAVWAEQVLVQSEKLEKRLRAVREFSDVSEAHRARIAAKKLRYVLEPVAKLNADGEAIIDTLKALQDRLGDLHDVHVFADEVVGATEKAAASRARRVWETVLTTEAEQSENERVRRARARDPGPGLLGLARRLRERGMEAFAAIDREWLNDAGAEFFERVRRLTEDIGKQASVGTEIQPSTSETAPELPEWLHEVFDRKVTAEREYFNGNLAKSAPPRAQARQREENPHRLEADIS
jgi:CHAD domain-containing protein